jgi:hypothetical protein
MAMVHELDVSKQSPALAEKSKGLKGEIIRDYVPKEGVKWRFGTPNYSKVNAEYFKNRTKKHPEDSLESVVTKLVKNWEVESHHIADPKQWQTMDTEKFQVSLNGGQKVNAQVMADIGPYNLLLGDIKGYKASANSFESANTIFSNTFPEGFAWEVLEVYTGPPDVMFQWRHWGTYAGEFEDDEGNVFDGDHRRIEVTGVCMAKVNGDLKIEELQVYYDPSKMIDPLRKAPAAGLCSFACGGGAAAAEEDDE